ncbi:MAG: hypothetical protein V1866_02275 [archaeon]
MESFGKTLIVVVLTMVLAQSFMLVLNTYRTVDYYKEHFEPTGQASGIVGLCINERPSLNISDCNPSATQDVYYDCWLGGNDTETANSSLIFGSYFVYQNRSFNRMNGTFFNASENGHVNFTPTNNEVGNYSIMFSVMDDSGCSNHAMDDLFNLTILNVNDAPYPTRNISSITFSNAGESRSFYLNDYFADPDLDPLTYSYIASSSAFTITISNSSEVIISNSVCNISDVVIFVARDPSNATNTSNAVSIRCISSPTQAPGSSGAGSGGGGGGGVTRLCKPEYECFDYHMCTPNGTKIQRCVDTHGCEKDVFLTVPCKYERQLFCNESWNCSGWNQCSVNGTQYRNCTDDNTCGTKKNIPLLVQKCEYIGSCSDSIKNCHNGSCEEGIDCGGPCSSCKNIEVPYAFKEEQGIGMYILTGIILLLLTAILLYHYFRKEVNAALARAGWWLSGRKKKQILLQPEDKKKLLAELNNLEKRFNEMELFEALNKYSGLLRFYLLKVCDGALLPEFEKADLAAALEKKKRRICKLLRKIFLSMFSRFDDIIKNEALITKTNIKLLMEELRNLTLQTSVVEPADYAREIKEFAVPDKADETEKTRITIINIYIALEFLEVDAAKKKYLEMTSDYEKLLFHDQELVFGDIARLYDNISYVNSWMIRPGQ